MADYNEKGAGSRRDSDATATNVEDTHANNNTLAPPQKEDNSMSHADHQQHHEKQRKKSFVDVDDSELSAAFENPLAGLSKSQLMQNVEDFCRDNNLMDHLEDFKKGALVAQNPADAQNLAELSQEEKLVLEREHTHRWSQPLMLYWLVVMCSMAAAVQGMDETVNNGAQALYLKDLNVTTERFSTGMVDNLTGLIVGAPYLCCAILGCWLTEPMNQLFARRGTIFISCAIAAVASIWEGVANSWVNLFIARFVLGLVRVLPQA